MTGNENTPLTFAEKVARAEKCEAEEAKRMLKLKEQALDLDHKYRAELGAKGVAFQTVVTEVAVFAFKTPDPLDFRKASLKITDGRPEDRSIHVHALLLSCLLAPSPEEFNRWMNDKPAIDSVLLRAVTRLAGLYEVESEKK